MGIGFLLYFAAWKLPDSIKSLQAIDCLRLLGFEGSWDCRQLAIALERVDLAEISYDLVYGASVAKVSSIVHVELSYAKRDGKLSILKLDIPIPPT